MTPSERADSGWISVEERLPEYDKRPGSFGTAVLIHPPYSQIAYRVEREVFYGVRVSDEPNFYKYGNVVTGVTHWHPMPDPPEEIS